MTDFTGAERVMLDRATVPAMRVGFARDIVAAAGAGAGGPRRTSRGGWRRHGRVLLGAGALVIASATAAATGLLDRLPIRIPGITRPANPTPKPQHIVHATKPHMAQGKTTVLAAIPMPVVPLIDPTPTLQDVARERRAARIAAGLPVRRPLLQRAMAAKLRGLPPAQRQAAIAEWRRIKALPPAERRIAVAKVKADFLATRPGMAKRYEQWLEKRAAAAADGKPPAASPPVAAPQPQAGPLTPDQRLERRRRWQAMNAGLTLDQRAARREAMRQWRMQRRAQRLQEGSGGPAEGIAPPVR